MRYRLNGMPIIWIGCLMVTASFAQCAFADNVSHGEQIFKKAGCFQCHQGGGNMIMPKKPLKGDQFAKDFPNDSMIVYVIRNGIKNSPMAAFSKERINDTDMKDLVAYIRSLTPKTAAH